jgi:hypothetical protein
MMADCGAHGYTAPPGGQRALGRAQSPVSPRGQAVTRTRQFRQSRPPHRQMHPTGYESGSSSYRIHTQWARAVQRGGVLSVMPISRSSDWTQMTTSTRRVLPPGRAGARNDQRRAACADIYRPSSALLVPGWRPVGHRPASARGDEDAVDQATEPGVEPGDVVGMHDRQALRAPWPGCGCFSELARRHRTEPCHRGSSAASGRPATRTALLVPWHRHPAA